MTTAPRARRRPAKVPGSVAEHVETPALPPLPGAEKQSCVREHSGATPLDPGESASPDTVALAGDPLESDSFGPQWAYVTSEALRNVAKCSRRSGKTEGEIRRGRRFLVRGKNVLYIGRVLKNVRQQFCAPFRDGLNRYGVEFKEQGQDLVFRPAAGGMLMAMSADDTRDIEKGRGYRWDLVMLDEAQSFPDEVLEPLIDMILIPTLIDTGGALDLLGTPPDPTNGDAMTGYFVRTIREAEANPSADPRKGWRLHEWTMYANPHIPQANISEAYAARGIGPGHPIWESEVMGRIVDNPANRVFPYDPTRNAYAAGDL